MDLFKRVYEIVTKFKLNSLNGETKLKKQLSDEIIKLFRAVS